MKAFISAVIPCYNEESSIVKVIKDAHRALDYLCRNFEIIVVNDGSTDNTQKVLEKASRDYPRVRIITHTVNKGYGGALISGLSEARGDYILTVDGDGQFDMRELSYILKGLKYSDIVIGYRIKRKDHFMRSVNSFIFNWAVRIFFGLWVKDVNCSMKGFRQDVIKKLQIVSQGALVNVDILTQAMRYGFKIVQVPIHHFPRISGSSTGANKKVILKSLYEFTRLLVREFPLRYKEFSFRQRTTIGFLLAIILLLFSVPVSGWHFAGGCIISVSGLLLRNWAGGYVEKGTQLAISGPYAYIRHPLYAGSLLLGAGFCLMASNGNHVVVTSLFWILLVAYFVGVYMQKIIEEEKHLKRIFHKEYDEYAQAVPRFIPFKGKFSKSRKSFNRALWKKNREYNSIVGFTLAIIWLLFKMK